MDLLDYFTGDALSFTNQTVNGTQSAVSSQVMSAMSSPIDFINPNVPLVAFKMVNNSALLLTKGTSTDTSNYWLFLYSQPLDILNPTQNSSLITQNKSYPIIQMMNNMVINSTIYSIEVVPSTGNYYILMQQIISSPVGTRVGMPPLVFDVIIQGSIVNFTSPEVVYNRSSSDQTYATNPPLNRTLILPTISLLSGAMFQVEIRAIGNPSNPSINKLLTLSYLPWVNLANISIDFTQVYNSGASTLGVDFVSAQFYGHDLFIFASTLIFRAELGVDNFKIQKTKTFPVQNLTSGDIQVTEEHLDVYYTSGSNTTLYYEVRKLRWDLFDNVFALDSMFYTKTFKIKNVVINGRMIAMYAAPVLFGLPAVMIARGQNSNIFALLRYKGTGYFQSAMSIDGLSIALLETSQIAIYRLRSSAYLTVPKPKNDVITLSSHPFANPGSAVSVQITTELWPEGARVLNVENSNTESTFLSETVSSEFVLNKNVPAAWFMGNFLQLSVNCDKLPDQAVNISSYRVLTPKKMNINSRGLNSRNIFYYEIYSVRVNEAYILVFQLELNIYVQSCLLSQQNGFLCRTIKKVSNEPDMIIEGTIIKGKYFMYLTNRGYFLINLMDPKDNKSLLMESLGTCKQLDYMGYNMIVCSNFAQKSLLIQILRPDGVINKLYSKANLYSTQIDFPAGSQFLFLLNEYTIDVISIRTSNLVSYINSTVTQRSDKVFKICGNYLIVYSVVMNSFEQYDVSDVFNIVQLQKAINLGNYSLRLIPSVTTKFEKNCGPNWPLMVTDGNSVYTLFVNIGAPAVDILESLYYVGGYHYLANFFVSGMNYLDSSNRPRTFWSILDTSNADTAAYFGQEIEIFKDFFMQIDMTKAQAAEGQKSLNVSCNLTLSSFQNMSNWLPETKIPFTLETNVLTASVGIAGTSSSFQDSVFELAVFDSITKMNISAPFTGQPITYYFNSDDRDYQTNIVMKEKVLKDENFSTLIKTARESTQILDFSVSRRNSFYILTNEAVYKIKNATDYYVQNYMLFTNADLDGGKISCRNILLNEETNLMVNLCSQAQVPIFYLSNWNSLKPGIVYTKQVEKFPDIDKIRMTYNNGNDIYLFSKTQIINLAMSTMYQKYRLEITPNEQATAVIVLVNNQTTSLATEFLFITEFLNTSIYSPQIQNDVYFITLVGSNKFVTDTYIVIYRDDQFSHNLENVFNISLQQILGPQFSGFFSSIINMDCKSLNDPSKGNYIGCGMIQERNLHYVVQLNMTYDKKTGQTSVTAFLRNLMMGYANQEPKGPMAFNEDFFVIVSNRDSGTANTSSSTFNLMKTYLIIYDITDVYTPGGGLDSELSRLTKPSYGIPLGIKKEFATLYKPTILDINGITYLFLVSNNYYSFQTFRLQKTNLIEVSKNLVSSNIELVGLNHYSQSTIRYKVYDKFLRIIIWVASIVGVLILLAFVYTIFKGKKKQKSTTFGNNLDTIARVQQEQEDGEDEDDLSRIDRVTGEHIPSNLGEVRKTAHKSRISALLKEEFKPGFGRMSLNPNKLSRRKNDSGDEEKDQLEQEAILSEAENEESDDENEAKRPQPDFNKYKSNNITGVKSLLVGPHETSGTHDIPLPRKKVGVAFKLEPEVQPSQVQEVNVEQSTPVPRDNKEDFLNPSDSQAAPQKDDPAPPLKDANQIFGSMMEQSAVLEESQEPKLPTDQDPENPAQP